MFGIKLRTLFMTNLSQNFILFDFEKLREELLPLEGELFTEYSSTHYFLTAVVHGSILISRSICCFCRRFRFLASIWAAGPIYQQVSSCLVILTPHKKYETVRLCLYYCLIKCVFQFLFNHEVARVGFYFGFHFSRLSNIF